MKVSVIGAGNVGATAADVMASRSICSEIVLLDIKEGFAEGKALDIMQTSTTRGFDTIINGTTGDYSKTKNSDVVVITSGMPRKPGMSRSELIGINAKIVKTIYPGLDSHPEKKIAQKQQHSPNGNIVYGSMVSLVFVSKLELDKFVNKINHSITINTSFFIDFITDYTF